MLRQVLIVNSQVYNHFVLRTNYDAFMKETRWRSPFTPIVPILFDRPEIVRKISKEAHFYFTAAFSRLPRIGRLSPSRWKSSPRIPYFCLVRSVHRVEKRVLNNESNVTVVELVITGMDRPNPREDVYNKLRPRFSSSTSGILVIFTVAS